MRTSRAVLNGLAAGAAGTAALNAVTYADVAARGRPPSEVPAKAAGKISEIIGVPLERRNSIKVDCDDESVAANRRQGIGALLGYMTGLGLGAGYGALRSGPARSLPKGLAGVGLGAAAIASTDVSYMALGVANPRTWGIRGWLPDIIPHVVYGVAAAVVFDRLD